MTSAADATPNRAPSATAYDASERSPSSAAARARLAQRDPLVEYQREGGDNTTVRKLPGKTTYSDITLKWGLTDSRELYEWYRQVIKGNVQRKNGSIIVLDLDGQEKIRWNFFHAWPAKWDGPDMSAKGNDVSIETLELAHEGIERA